MDLFVFKSKNEIRYVNLSWKGNRLEEEQKENWYNDGIGLDKEAQKLKSKVGSINAIKQVGQVVVAAGFKEVYLKENSEWKKISENLAVPEKEIIQDITGSGASDIYVCSYKFIWHYDGEVWVKCDLPDTSSFSKMHYNKDGLVYVITSGYSIVLEGKENNWKEVARFNGSSLVLEDIVAYKEKILIPVFPKGIHEYKNGQLTPVFQDAPVSGASHIAVNDNLVVISRNSPDGIEACLFDGETWIEGQRIEKEFKLNRKSAVKKPALTIDKALKEALSLKQGTLGKKDMKKMLKLFPASVDEELSEIMESPHDFEGDILYWKKDLHISGDFDLGQMDVLWVVVNGSLYIDGKYKDTYESGPSYVAVTGHLEAENVITAGVLKASDLTARHVLVGEQTEGETIVLGNLSARLFVSLHHFSTGNINVEHVIYDKEDLKKVPLKEPFELNDLIKMVEQGKQIL